MVQPPGTALGMVAPSDVKYDFEPANPDPGDDYDKFRERALNAMSTSAEPATIEDGRSPTTSWASMAVWRGMQISTPLADRY